MTLTESPAEKLYAAKRAYAVAEDQILNSLASIFGFEWGGQKIPCQDVTFDDYDSSFEFKDCINDLRATPEQCLALWELGFWKFWLCHLDGSETLYAKGYESGTRKEKP